MDGLGKPLDSDMLVQAWGLTPVEAQVALLLHGGATIAAIAQHRGTSIHTVRHQVKSAMMKSESTRQLDLVMAIERLPRK